MIDPSSFPVPFEPITGPLTPMTIAVIVGEFVVFYVAAHVGAAVAYRLSRRLTKIEMVRNPDFSWAQVLMAGPLEEMGFRGTAVLLSVEFGLPLVPMLFLANGVWSGYHFRNLSAFVYTFVLGIFLTKFWYGGFTGLAWMAILIHSLHNAINFALTEPQRRKTKQP